MHHTWIKQDTSTTLHLIFLGWAAGPEILGDAGLEESRCDVVCVYDYDDLSIDIDFSEYREIRITAWSFGVWVAEYLFGGDARVGLATAINGTTRPVDEKFGIHPKAFALTERAVQRVGIDKFVAQMCLQQTQQYLQVAKLRPINRLSHELKFLGESFASTTNRPIQWTRAIVAMSDAIFPPEAMINHWKTLYPKTGIKTVDRMPHLWMPSRNCSFWEVNDPLSTSCDSKKNV